MTIIFVSNYINHHQIPFCEEMISLLGADDHFYFIQTEDMENDRKQMGWDNSKPGYVLCAYESEEMNKKCRQLIFESEVVIFGGCEDESYMKPRLEDIKRELHEINSTSNKQPEANETTETAEGAAVKRLTFRYSERVYKEGQWKFITPRGLAKKKKDHTRYNDIPIYLLCAGGYVASDFALFGAYKNKMYRWGYFPKTEELDIDEVISNKGSKSASDASGLAKETQQENIVQEKLPYILWSGRALDWKHPEYALKTAQYLKKKSLKFRMEIIGGETGGEKTGKKDGEPERGVLSRMRTELSVEDCVELKDFVKPEEMRELMKNADIYLMTSDRKEGWGAVANEAMNSACCLVAGSMEGAIPYLCRNGENALVYKDGDLNDLFTKTEKALTDEALRKRIGKDGYKTITEEWNAHVAAVRLMQFINAFREGKELPEFESGPLSKEKPRAERRISKETAGA